VPVREEDHPPRRHERLRGDNTDLLILSEGYELVEREIANVVAALARFAEKQAAVPTVAFTHFQPAQFTTVGKRACLWIQDLLFDLDEIAERRASLRFLGVKGTTGTQASFLSLFEGDERKVKKLDEMVARAMGFERTYAVSGQTYSRKIDAQAQATLSGVAQSSHKFANDMRLLQHLREIQEPFDEHQVGSSAMAYKRNPMKSERMTSLARLVLSLQTNASFTAASQWFERTLDDSAGEAHRAAGGVPGGRRDPAAVHGRGVAPARESGGDGGQRDAGAAGHRLGKPAHGGREGGRGRQELHEVIRRHKMETKEGDLLDRLKNDEAFKA
jgi:adenylosuccinate lyase